MSDESLVLDELEDELATLVDDYDLEPLDESGLQIHRRYPETVRLEWQDGDVCKNILLEAADDGSYEAECNA